MNRAPASQTASLCSTSSRHLGEKSDQYTFFPCELVAKILHRDLAKDALTSLFGEGYFLQLKTWAGGKFRQIVRDWTV